MNEAFPNGNKVYEEEVARIKAEKERAALQMAKQIVNHYRNSASYRTGLDHVFHFEVLQDLALKYVREGDVAECALQLLRDNGWECSLVKNGFTTPDLKIKPLAAAGVGK